MSLTELDDGLVRIMAIGAVFSDFEKQSVENHHHPSRLGRSMEKQQSFRGVATVENQKRGVIMEKLPSFCKAATMERQKSFRGGFLEKHKRFCVVMERQLSFIGETPLYTAAENGHSAVGEEMLQQRLVFLILVVSGGEVEWSIHGYWSGAFTSDRELLFHCLVSLSCNCIFAIHKVIYSILYFNLSSKAIHNNFHPSLYIFAIHLKSIQISPI
ncbi:unnamed protein product [Brassica oleracea]